jgi:3-oxoacyl-[acyl-carrier protein] reductase
MEVNMSLKEQVVLVTGSGQGIGQAIALRFSKEGARVVVADVNMEGVSDTIKKIKSMGGDCLGLMTDVTINEQVEDMVNQTVHHYGTLDILVNNAGIVRPGSIEDLSEEDWDAVVNVNLKGTFLCSKHAAKVMIQNRKGGIINIASIIGHEPFPAIGAYAPTKAAVIMLTKQCAMAWGKYNIRVNSISPGFIWTSIGPAMQDPSIRESRSALIPLGRLGSVEDVAAAAAMLSSDDSSYITGAELEVDGGLMRNWMDLVPGRPTAKSNPDQQ